MTPAIEIHTERIAEFCARHRIHRLALFGSVLRPDFRPRHMRDATAEARQFAAGKMRAHLDHDRMLILAILKDPVITTRKR